MRCCACGLVACVALYRRVCTGERSGLVRWSREERFMRLFISTEPIGSIPRPLALIETAAAKGSAFAKIKACVDGTALAAEKLGEH